MKIDISLPVEDSMPKHPTAYLSGVSCTQIANHQKHKRSIQKVTFSTHISTHIDAPYHTIPNGITVDQIPLDKLCGEAKIITIKNKSYQNPIDVNDLMPFENQLKKFSKIIFNTGWSDETWGQKKYFINGPYLTRNAAKYLGNYKHELLAIDFPNVDSPEDTKVGVQNPNHAILLRNSTILLENIINLKNISKKTVRLYCLPIKLVGGDGCPCRAIVEV